MTQPPCRGRGSAPSSRREGRRGTFSAATGGRAWARVLVTVFALRWGHRMSTGPGYPVPLDPKGSKWVLWLRVLLQPTPCLVSGIGSRPEVRHALVLPGGSGTPHEHPQSAGGTCLGHVGLFFPSTEIVVINLSTCLSFKDKQTEVQVGERHFPGHRAASRVCQSRVDGLPAVSAGSLNDTRQHQNPKVTLLDLVGDDEVKREGSECLYLNNQMVHQANGRWRTKARVSQRCGSWG